MRKLFVQRTFFVVPVLLLLSAGFSPSGYSEEGSDHPCRELMDACKAKGYVPGEPKDKPGKSVLKNCVKPLLDGQTVADMAVDEKLKGLIAGCKARKEDPKLKEKREERKKKRLEGESAG